MIQSLDDTLYHLLAHGLTTLASPTPGQIRFQPPDAKWRQHVGTLGAKSAVNVYLVDVRENRMLRSNETVRVPDPRPGAFGEVWELPAPGRADCHYLITAWSNADEDLSAADRVELGRTGAEHEVLHDVASLLYASQPLVPAEVFGGTFPAWFADDLKDAVLPTMVLPVEGFPKYAEFWGTMGTLHPWKPAVYLIVTVPLATRPRHVGEPVTTELVGYRLNGGPVDETWITIGVEALHGGAAVPGAWVRLETPGGVAVAEGRADASGHVVFEEVAPGSYVLQARAAGLVTPPPTPIDIPSANGGYRVSFP